VLRNTLAGSKTWFLGPRMTLYPRLVDIPYTSSQHLSRLQHLNYTKHKPKTWCWICPPVYRPQYPNNHLSVYFSFPACVDVSLNGIYNSESNDRTGLFTFLFHETLISTQTILACASFWKNGLGSSCVKTWELCVTKTNHDRKRGGQRVRTCVCVCVCLCVYFGTIWRFLAMPLPPCARTADPLQDSPFPWKATHGRGLMWHQPKIETSRRSIFFWNNKPSTHSHPTHCPTHGYHSNELYWVVGKGAQIMIQLTRQPVWKRASWFRQRPWRHLLWRQDGVSHSEIRDVVCGWRQPLRASSRRVASY